MAASWPPTYTPSYLNEYNGMALIGTVFAFMILSTGIVVLHFYVQTPKNGIYLGLDDYLVGPALVANIALQITCLGKQLTPDLKL